jgi:hypothetical protein
MKWSCPERHFFSWAGLTFFLRSPGGGRIPKGQIYFRYFTLTPGHVIFLYLKLINVTGKEIRSIF